MAAANVKSAYMQTYAGVSSPPSDMPHTHLSGERELSESLGGVRFRISPNAFFQVCVRVCARACVFACIGNTEFRCGKAEDVLDQVLLSLGGRECIALVDPPRAGLHVNVLKALRGCEKLRHLIYVSCNPNGWVADAENLCRPQSKAYRGDPFRPVRAIPIDLFPDTAHCELVVHMVRMPLSEPSPGLSLPPQPVGPPPVPLAAVAAEVAEPELAVVTEPTPPSVIAVQETTPIAEEKAGESK
ncbi:hypothetical protein T492DRAFT_1027138 [Pavlovales sp. CCMP2436]|nr:hypothetical protein T492DRAFT_1027138 [Pavlovales sp. CCMP2436]